MKKSEQTKAKLVEAVINLTNVGQKISVASITKEAKTAYGSFYRYFDNLDEINAAAIMQVVLNAAEVVDNQMKTEKSNIFKIYYSWYIAIDLFESDYIANWLIDNPANINDAWAVSYTHLRAHET